MKKRMDILETSDQWQREIATGTWTMEAPPPPPALPRPGEERLVAGLNGSPRSVLARDR